MSLLSIRDLTVHHGLLRAVDGVSLELERGEVLAVIGANGAGKSTLLRALAGLNTPTSGTVHLAGRDITRSPAHQRVSAGIALVPEGRRLFRSLTVEENLLTGTYRKRTGPWSLRRVYELFPWMTERRRQNAAQLSGGEQQAVAIGRALLTNPDLLLVDELSLGLAPVIVRRIYETLPEIVAAGTTALVVEQDVSQALRVADRVHCLLEGRSVLAGRPAELTAEQVEHAYFGIGDLTQDGKD
ncbi:High-affinity branched-chain amino acid transport ATP-binding protein LivF [Nonomuraea coxensis DSM 45129]|uniref:High-affinity branched-chain amino acid transport ATP-binding protein LivF n=1 Tax=Nonomuraea coxensis DSM 45129 TaxID=1122611 RepID=A0ABX8U535_9ACTN|nr:ABC transporter ATP-binding protein [Nonomuraea coxensis]QYC41742.1 High-affinity branched-chain amino acid transport ATP-binding protein LivF [Nonomuraea coxensis DSM 45129]